MLRCHLLVKRNTAVQEHMEVRLHIYAKNTKLWGENNRMYFAVWKKRNCVLHKKEIHMGLKWHQVSISKQNLSKLWKNANKTFYCVENQPWRNSIWRRHQWNIFSVFAAYYCGTFCSWFKMQYEKRWMDTVPGSCVKSVLICSDRQQAEQVECLGAELLPSISFNKQRS